MTEKKKPCLLCRNQALPYFNYKKQNRTFLFCPVCRLIFQEILPDEEEERRRYSLHQNSAADAGYVQWLEKFVSQGVLPWYKGGPLLDFGSGPEPVLSEFLKKDGIDVTGYDKYFAPEWPRENLFRFVVLSEVLEHLRNPVAEFEKIASVSSEDARIVLQSSFVRDFRPQWFSSWWYKEDSTHTRFFSASSLSALGHASGWELQYQDGRSIGVFKKKTRSTTPGSFIKSVPDPSIFF